MIDRNESYSDLKWISGYGAPQPATHDWSIFFDVPKGFVIKVFSCVMLDGPNKRVGVVQVRFYRIGLTDSISVVEPASFQAPLGAVVNALPLIELPMNETIYPYLHVPGGCVGMNFQENNNGVAVAGTLWMALTMGVVFIS